MKGEKMAKQRFSSRISDEKKEPDVSGLIQASRGTAIKDQLKAMAWEVYKDSTAITTLRQMNENQQTREACDLALKFNREFEVWWNKNKREILGS